MRQLYIFIIQFLFILLCEQIDTAFINNVSLDAICVLSAFLPIMWTSNKFRDMGLEGYKVLRANRMNCLIVCVAGSAFASLLCISLSGIIPNIYSLTDTQRELLHRCFIMEGIGLVFQGIEHYIYSWLLLECRNRETIIYSSILYAMMIGSDAFIYCKGYSVEYFMLATSLCNFLQVIIYFLFTDFFTREPISKTIVKDVFKHSARMLYDGLTGKIATLFYNIWASKLGTELYAIHAVCYNICTQEEYVSNAVYTFTLTYLKKFNKRDMYTEVKNIIRKNMLPVTLIVYFVAFLLLALTHGSVNMKDCIIYLVVYVLDVIALFFYEVFKGYLVCNKQTSVTKNGGTIGILIRIPSVLAGYYCGLGIWAFAIPCILDFSARAFYFWMNSRKINREILNN